MGNRGCSSKVLLNLTNKGTYYADNRTIENWNKIYKFLANKKRDAERDGKRNPRWIISRIVKHCNISGGQVRWALMLMHSYVRPDGKVLFKFGAQNLRNGRIANTVTLLNYSDNDDSQ